VNWLAVGASTIISYLFASFWYSPSVFGKRWADRVGLKLGTDESFSINALVSQFFATLLLAWIVSLIVGNGSLAFIVLISLTIFFFLLSANLIAKHSTYASLVEATFVLVISLIMTVCNLLL
tara:strand:- start:164 stop:529 length:366 start_codon:yes stop_codon:yes gene_type:complete